MTVRLTPTESDTTPPPPVPAPPLRGDSSVTAPDAPTEGPVDPPPGDPAPASDAGPAADSRRAVRESRRQRRRTAWLCAAVVAACLALTIVVVMLARDRPAAPPSALAPASHGRPLLVPAATLDRAVRPTVPTHGAPAPEGGNP